MIKRIRQSIKDYFLKEEIERLEKTRAAYVELGSKKVSIEEVFRVQMAGYDPALHETEDDLEVLYAEKEELQSFLASIKDLQKHDGLQSVINVLIRNQVLHTSLQATSLEEMNFGRATVNGLRLLQQEIDRLSAIYEEMHRKEEEYDKNDVV